MTQQQEPPLEFWRALAQAYAAEMHATTARLVEAQANLSILAERLRAATASDQTKET